MAPSPTILALVNNLFHVGSSNGSDVVTYIETPVDQHFSISTTLNVPYIDPNNGHVRFQRDLDYSWFGC